MSEDFEAHFNGEASEPAIKPETTEGQPRDESGRFAPKQTDTTPEPVTETAPAATPAAPAAPVEPAKPQGETGHIPINALLDEREKRQKAERRLAELEARQQTPTAPPTFQTPEEIAAYVQREAANAAWSAKIDFSESHAREKHGDAVVEAAMQWNIQKCEAEKAALGFSPFAVEQMRERNPVDWVVRQHKRDEVVSKLGDDPDAWVRQRALELGLVATPEQAPAAPAAAPTQPVAPKPPPPRPSLANATSAGGMQTVPVVAPFEATFK